MTQQLSAIAAISVPERDSVVTASLGRRLTLWLPLGMLAAYLLGMLAMPRPKGLWFTFTLSELGVIELGTAALYLAASATALLLAIKARSAPVSCRMLYLLVAAVALFICLEEANYGQFIYDSKTGQWFSEDIKENETNLHKLAEHKPARRMNLVATLGFPLWCLALPLVGARRRWWTRSHWSAYLLPRLELALIALLAQAMSWLDDFYFDLLKRPKGENYWARATEFKELYWALGAFLLMQLLWRRNAGLRKAASQA